MILEGRFVTKSSEEKKSNLLSKVESRVQKEFRQNCGDSATSELDSLSQLKANIKHLSELQAKSRFMVRELRSLTSRT